MKLRTAFGLSPAGMNTLIGFLGAAILLFLFREQWLGWIGNFLVVEDSLKPADVIHVIAGEDYRTDYAIQLYKNGYGNTLFFTGGWCDVHLYNHGEHAQERALAQGVPIDAIAFDDSKVTSTYMEAQNLSGWIAQNESSVRSIIVVSDPFHMRRVRWIYRKMFGPEIEIEMAPVPFEVTVYQRDWWKDPQSRNYVQEEYTKFIYYQLRYQYSSGKFKEWLISLDTE
jgi:uncharacterized SAM-binding protein YcdF (DUF218 family)